MANIPDPLEDLIADGRLTFRPPNHYGVPTVLTVNLEFMYTRIQSIIETLCLGDNNLRNEYGPSSERVNQLIRNDAAALADFAVGQTYNRLRNILESKAPNIRTARMNTRCPIPGNLEFPTWLSSTLSTIGPIRVKDGPTDQLIVYASTAATMANYGRDAPVVFSEGGYARLMAALRRLGVAMSPFPAISPNGSSFPTLAVEANNNSYTVYGTFPESHYENEDLARIALFTNPLGVTPFQDISMIIGSTDNAAVIQAVSALVPDHPIGQAANSTGRPVHGYFNVNYWGIQPEVPAAGTTPAVPAKVYLVGFGRERYYHFMMAHSLSSVDVLAILRNRLFRR